MTILRAATAADIPTIVALNAAVVDVTSPMDAENCRVLMDLASWSIVAEVDGQIIAFVLAMRDGAPYENGNFQWFSDRLRNFVYIDRVVVGEGGRGQRLGSRIYDAVCDVARKEGCHLMAAEMNIDPPNLASLNFHKARGFGQIGTRRLDKGATVSMQVCGL